MSRTSLLLALLVLGAVLALGGLFVLAATLVSLPVASGVTLLAAGLALSVFALRVES